MPKGTPIIQNPEIANEKESTTELSVNATGKNSDYIDLEVKDKNSGRVVSQTRVVLLAD